MASSELNKLHISKRALTRSLKKTYELVNNYLPQTASPENVFQIEAGLTECQSILIDLKSTCLNILGLLEHDTTKSAEDIAKEETDVMKDYESYRSWCWKTTGKLKAMKSVTEGAAQRQSILDTTFREPSASISSAPKFPDIPVPKFDGELKNFTNWFALFENMFHQNDRLEPVQKLYYLKSAMTGKAADLLTDFPLDNDAYKEAWNFIKARFYNKRAIIATHFRTLTNLPFIKSDGDIRSLLDLVNVTLRGLKICDIDVDALSPLVTFLVASKLESRLRDDWENSIQDNSKYPSFDTISSFLQNRSFAFEGSQASTSSNKKVNSPNTTEKESKPVRKLCNLVNSDPSSAATRDSNKCPVCSSNHFISTCEKFLQKSLLERYNFAKELHLCTNCLRSGHKSSQCRSSMCRKCNSRHNTLLHRDSPSSDKSSASKGNSSPTSSSSSSPQDTASKSSSLSMVNSNRKLKFLRTAIAYVKLHSRLVKARILLDDGSQPNLISGPFVRRNHIPVEESSSRIFGISDSITSMSSTTIEIHSRNSSFKLCVEVDVINNIPYTVETNVLKDFQQSLCAETLQFADNEYNYPYVDILLGIEHVDHCLFEEKHFINETCIRNSHFGWIVSGPIAPTTYCNLVSTCLEDQLQSFWKLEEIDSKPSTESEHNLCKEFVDRSIQRNAEGQFMVRLPVKNDLAQLSNTYSRALRNLKIIKSEHYASIRPAYIDFMRKYERLGHMELVPDYEISRNRVYYIPHRAVLRPESTTTKLRVVFNASAKVKPGKSLNECLMIGPVIQKELFEILLNFRIHCVAFMADITKMYRCVLVHPDDRDLQRILWREDPNSRPKTYRLKTVTYGTAPASFLATYCLAQLAEELKSSHPEAADAILNSFYMDDLLTGANSVSNAIALKSVIHDKLLSAHLPLRKYASNSKEFLDSIDASLLESEPSNFFNECVSVLGLSWYCSSDLFRVKVRTNELPAESLITKRFVLSEISKVFDTFGLVCPVTIRGKILMKDIWREGQKWDDPVSAEIRQSFILYYRDLPSLSNFSIPRAYSSFENISSYNLIGFCDASQLAYCSVVYIQAHNGDSYETSFCCAKTRVSPMKELTIPKLELTAATQLIRLLSLVQSKVKLSFNHIYAFSDSTVVLAWLANPAKNFKSFVCNRTSFIKETLPNVNWNYVNTKENPADLATRGISTEAFLKNSLWKNGPAWLNNDLNDSIPKFNVNTNVDLPESKKASNISMLSLNVNDNSIDDSILHRYSSFNKLLNVTAYIKRLFNYKSRCNSSIDLILSCQERNAAFKTLIRISQHCYFRKDILRLSHKLPLSKKSTLKHLNPFLDADNILRVGGRLQNATISYDAKHLIILHRKCKLVELYIQYLHNKFFHATKSLLMTLISSKFWIVNGLPKVIKKLVYRCIVCTRYRAQVSQQLMGNLPAYRVNVSRPFTHTGVDLCGPYSIKCLGHRSIKYNKAYTAIFVCLITRAVHIEIVPDLTSEMFIASLLRFTSRRGIPQKLYSDNATNFVGTRNFFDSNRDTINQHCAVNNIDWSFIPPRSPHHGGIWEAAVKSAKYYLLRATNSTTFTYENLVTLFTRIEGILNSRPLCYKPNASIDDLAVTPAHFLIGQPLHEVPVVNSPEVPLPKHLESYRQIINSFWTNWRTSYLTQLQRRVKWTSETSNLEVGQVVVLKEDGTKPGEWPLGRVTKVHPGPDGCVRVVNVLTTKGEYRRPITKIVILPVNTSRTSLSSNYL